MTPINQPTEILFHRWQPRACIRVSGSDAATFLQGQFTNNLRTRPDRPAAVYGLWLSVKGKVVADSFVLHHGDVYWVVTYYSRAADILARLEPYIIADDVALEDRTGEYSGLTLLGAEAGQVAELQAVLPDVLIFPGRRERGPNVEILYPTPHVETVERWLQDRLQLGGSTLDNLEMARRRIRAGIPAVPSDVGPNDLPNEAGLDSDAISYDKGCYLGQEVMARLRSMGQVRRRLLRVFGDGQAPSTPAPLFADARQAGEIRSAVPAGQGFEGLAMISLLQAKPGDMLALTPGTPPTVRPGDAV